MTSSTAPRYTSRGPPPLHLQIPAPPSPVSAEGNTQFVQKLPAPTTNLISLVRFCILVACPVPGDTVGDQRTRREQLSRTLVAGPFLPSLMQRILRREGSCLNQIRPQHEDRVPPVRSAGRRCRQQPQSRRLGTGPSRSRGP